MICKVCRRVSLRTNTLRAVSRERRRLVEQQAMDRLIIIICCRKVPLDSTLPSILIVKTLMIFTYTNKYITLIPFCCIMTIINALHGHLTSKKIKVFTLSVLICLSSILFWDVLKYYLVSKSKSY